MRKTSTTIAVCASLAVVSQTAWAMGFGRYSHATSLGQTLDLTIPVTAESSEQLTGECVSAEVQVGSTALPPSAVRANLEWLEGSGSRRLRVSTTVRIDEPVVTVTVTAGCPTRLTRELVLFIDPPPIAADAVASPAPAPQVLLPNPVADDPVTKPKPVVMASSGAAAPEAGAAAKPRKPAQHKAVTSKTSPSARPAARLQLEPAARVVTVQSPSAAELAASAAGAAAHAASEAEAVAVRQREAMQLMQKQLEALRVQTAAANQNILQMQASLEESRASSQWLLMVASGLAVALLGLLVWLVSLLRQRAALRMADKAWWSPESQQPAPSRLPDAAESSFGAASVPADAGPSVWASSLSSPETVAAVLNALPQVRSQTEFPAVLAAETSASWPLSASGSSRLVAGEVPWLTANELIDLAQQAEFFVALGQDGSAIALLQGHLSADGGGGAWPYLKLLEIQRRLGDHSAFSEVSALFEQRFGRPPAGWSDFVPAGQPLDAHRDLLRRIETVWSDPHEAMQLIETLLVRSGPASSTFGLAALDDLQSLYLLARSMAEPKSDAMVSDGVDLLLPLEPAGLAAAPAADAADTGIDFYLELPPEAADPEKPRG